VANRDPLFTAPFFRLWTFTLITFFTAFQLFPTIPFRIVDLGGTKSEAGLFLAIYTYACAIAAPITGSIADHFGRKKLLTVGAASFFLASLTYSVITSLPLLLFFACIHGIFWSAILSSSAAVMSEIIPPTRRTEGMGYWGMASTAAIAVAPLVGLTMYRRSWLTLCIEMALLSLVMLFMASRVRGGEHRASEAFPPMLSLIDWRVTVTALTLFVISFGYGGVTSYVAMMSLERKIEPTSLFFTVFAVTILLVRIFTGPLGDRIGPKRLLIPSVLVVPLALALLAMSHSAAALSGAAFLYGIGFGGAYPAFVAHVLDHTDPERRGATFGSILGAFDTGIGTGSLTIGVTVQHFGFTNAFLVGAAISTLSVPLFFLTAPLLRRGADVEC
jgi:MFS family permease